MLRTPPLKAFDTCCRGAAGFDALLEKGIFQE